MECLYPSWLPSLLKVTSINNIISMILRRLSKATENNAIYCQTGIMLCRSHDPTFSLPLVLWKKKCSSLHFGFLCLFCFFGHFTSNFKSDFESDFECDFFLLNPSHQLIVELCAYPSYNLISLSYSMPVFSANLFGLFLKYF